MSTIYLDEEQVPPLILKGSEILRHSPGLVPENFLSNYQVVQPSLLDDLFDRHGYQASH
jgi:hypothetical protein